MSVQFVVISGSFRQVKYKVNLVKMRSGEAAVITSVANRIAHFEQKQGEEQEQANLANLANIAVNNQKLKSSSRLTPSNFSQRYLDLDDIMEEESSIEDDSDGYLAASNEETSSPDTSFRLSGRSSSSGSEHSVTVKKSPQLGDGEREGTVENVEKQENDPDTNQQTKAHSDRRLSDPCLALPLPVPCLSLHSCKENQPQEGSRPGSLITHENSEKAKMTKAKMVKDKMANDKMVKRSRAVKRPLEELADDPVQAESLWINREFLENY